VRQVNDIIGRISVASTEQAEGIADVNRAVGQMDGMTQQNAALVEQAAAAAESLHEQTVNLAKAVAIFKIAQMKEQEQGGAAGAPAVRTEEEDEDDEFRGVGERRAPNSPMRPKGVRALAARRRSS
jgi:methyl-accepting chemotaxis protein